MDAGVGGALLLGVMVLSCAGYFVSGPPGAPPAEGQAELKAKHDKTLVIFGSGVLVQSLMRRELIDEYVLQIHPLVLGKGGRLFPDGSPLTRLTLVDSVTTATGVIIATYSA